MQPQWDPEHYHGHLSQRQALIIAVVATGTAMLVPIGIVAWMAWQVLHALRIL